MKYSNHVVPNRPHATFKVLRTARTTNSARVQIVRIEGIDSGQANLGPCSSRVQQPWRPVPTTSDPHRPADLRQRPPATFLPLDGKEAVN